MLSGRTVLVRDGKQVCDECRGELVFDPENCEQVCRVCGVVSEQR